MIRVEALNHNGKFRAIGIFEKNAKAQIKACIDENDDYYLRMQSSGKRRIVLWKNFDKIENDL